MLSKIFFRHNSWQVWAFSVILAAIVLGAVGLSCMRPWAEMERARARRELWVAVEAAAKREDWAETRRLAELLRQPEKPSFWIPREMKFVPDRDDAAALRLATEAAWRLGSASAAGQARALAAHPAAGHEEKRLAAQILADEGAWPEVAALAPELLRGGAEDWMAVRLALRLLVEGGGAEGRLAGCLREDVRPDGLVLAEVARLAADYPEVRGYELLLGCLRSAVADDVELARSGREILLRMACGRDEAARLAGLHLAGQPGLTRAEMPAVVVVLEGHPWADTRSRLWAAQLRVRLEPGRRQALLDQAVADYGPGRAPLARGGVAEEGREVVLFRAGPGREAAVEAVPTRAVSGTLDALIGLVRHGRGPGAAPVEVARADDLSDVVPVDAEWRGMVERQVVGKAAPVGRQVAAAAEGLSSQLGLGWPTGLEGDGREVVADLSALGEFLLRMGEAGRALALTEGRQDPASLRVRLAALDGLGRWWDAYGLLESQPQVWPPGWSQTWRAFYAWSGGDAETAWRHWRAAEDAWPGKVRPAEVDWLARGRGAEKLLVSAEGKF